ncbi:MAG: histidine kinase [Rikenellaceae bacterium]
MVNERKIRTIEYTAIILLWTLVVVAPLLFMDDYNSNWRAVHVMWVECAVVGAAFLVNRFLLMPYLFFAKRYSRYVMALTTLFLVLATYVLYFDGVNLIISSLASESFASDMPPMRGGGAPRHGMPPHRMPPMATIIPPYVSVLVLAAIVIALDIGMSIGVKWVIAEQKQSEIQRERVVAQLSNLQSQVSPHFFMNTLNNIHALVDIDSKRAKQTIIELSNLMDYLLYESSNKELVSLRREMEFITNYVNLMRLRFSKQVRIHLFYNDEIPAMQIPPLLFLNLIENAFKYGVDYEHESFVDIGFSFSTTSVEMIAQNSNHSLSVKHVRHGFGISNTRKRLELIYGDSYNLNIIDDEKIYIVTLKIPTL